MTKNEQKNLIAFGSLELLLTLNLGKNDVNNLNYNQLNNLSFLISNKKLWKKIVLSSDNEVLNTILRMNNIRKKKVKVVYLLLTAMEYDESNKNFKSLIDNVLLNNGFIIRCQPLTNCQIDIKLKIIYDDEIKLFSIFDINHFFDDKINIEDEHSDYNVEEKKEENNKIIDDIFNFISKNFADKHSFIYLNYKDYLQGGEFSGKFNIDKIYNLFEKIKFTTKIRIIMNFGEISNDKPELFLKFLKISDYHIINERPISFHLGNKIENLSSIWINDSTYKTNHIILTNINNKKKIHKNMSSRNFNLHKNLLQTIEKPNTNRSIYNSRKILNSSQNSNSYFPSLKKSEIYNLNQEINNTKSINFNHIYDKIFSFDLNKRHPNYNDKLGIYIKDFRALTLVQYRKYNSPLKPIKYELNLLPKPNIHNMKNIDKLKNIIYQNHNKYKSLMYGCILNILINDYSQKKDSLFLFYLYTRISLIRMLALDKNNLIQPFDKSFFYVNLNKKIINRFMRNQISKNQEEGFNNTNSQNEKQNKYCPLMDKFLVSYFQNSTNLGLLKRLHFISPKKKLLYDKEYSDNFKKISRNHINEKSFEKYFIKDIMKSSSNFEKDHRYQFLKKSAEYNCFIPGSNGVPSYIIYLNKNERRKMLKMKKISKLKSIKNSLITDNKDIETKSELKNELWSKDTKVK